MAEDKTAYAKRIDDDIIRVDGMLDEDIWNEAEVITDFIQKEPHEGDLPTNRIEVRILYDDEALYFGAKMFTGKPDQIRSVVSRRDKTGNSERIIVSIDSYNDNRTAYTFGLTASSVRFDYYHSIDREHNRDYSFDPVWTGKTQFIPGGWSAELKIPFSQLRFNEAENQVWGLNMNWWVPTLQEDIYWVLIPKNETGWSSKMGDLKGISGIKPSGRIEIMPYLSGSAAVNDQVNDDNPFSQKFDPLGRAGLDLKIGLGPNLTLDATINPDFGQVEADPAEVNLTAYETFFEEKRPFFTEGRKLLEGIGPGYFYSRRIGAKPHGEASGDYADYPSNTQILGAAKISGRMENGLSIGGLSALTAREKADIYFKGSDSTGSQIVEPLSSYNVIRLQQEFGENASTAGLMLTGVARDIDESSPLADYFNKYAVSGGSDWNIKFNGTEYELTGHLGFSHIEGNKERMLAEQRSSAHYFQRPDQDHVKIDSNATSLSGYTGSLNFQKNEGEHWLYDVSVYFETPGFEINDIGRLSSADDLNFNASLSYRENKPGDFYYSYNFEIEASRNMNFGLIDLSNYGTLFGNLTLPDRSQFNINYYHGFSGLSDDLTRGGPLMGTGNSNGYGLNYNSDWSQQFVWYAGVNIEESELGYKSLSIHGGINLKTLGALELSIDPYYSVRTNTRQYITTLNNGRNINYNKRYIFSSIDRTTLSASFRLNYAFTPDLTLELYAEPFAASGKYYNFGELPAPRYKKLRLYGTDGTSITETEEGIYQVEDGNDKFEIESSNFNYLSLRTNFVLRWEWLPGSTLYFVWQLNKSADDVYLNMAENEMSGRPVRPEDLIDTFSADGINTVALKISYWFTAD